MVSEEQTWSIVSVRINPRIVDWEQFIASRIKFNILWKLGINPLLKTHYNLMVWKIGRWAFLSWGITYIQLKSLSENSYFNGCKLCSKLTTLNTSNDWGLYIFRKPERINIIRVGKSKRDWWRNRFRPKSLTEYLILIKLVLIFWGETY